MTGAERAVLHRKRRAERVQVMRDALKRIQEASTIREAREIALEALMYAGD